MNTYYNRQQSSQRQSKIDLTQESLEAKTLSSMFSQNKENISHNNINILNNTTDKKSADSGLKKNAILTRINQAEQS